MMIYQYELNKYQELIFGKKKGPFYACPLVVIWFLFNNEINKKYLAYLGVIGWTNIENRQVYKYKKTEDRAK